MSLYSTIYYNNILGYSTLFLKVNRIFVRCFTRRRAVEHTTNKKMMIHFNVCVKILKRYSRVTFSDVSIDDRPRYRRQLFQPNWHNSHRIYNRPNRSACRSNSGTKSVSVGSGGKSIPRIGKSRREFQKEFVWQTRSPRSIKHHSTTVIK